MYVFQWEEKYTLEWMDRGLNEIQLEQFDGAGI